MFGELGSLVTGFDLSAVGPALGLVSVGIWMLRLQRVADYVRLGGILVAFLGLALAAGVSTDVLAIDGRALAALVSAAVDILAGGFRASVRAFGGA